MKLGNVFGCLPMKSEVTSNCTRRSLLKVHWRIKWGLPLEKQLS